MSRRITKVIVNKIISEPGDMTRYEYLAIPVSTNYTAFISYNNFKYPAEISHIEIANINNFTDVIKYTMTNYKDINPNTMLECINYIRSINNLPNIER